MDWEMLVQIGIPIVTLIIGYFLNVWHGSIESKREIKRRRIAEKEKAYAQITAKLHELFETYRLLILAATDQDARIRLKLKGPPDEGPIIEEFDELEMLVYENSLYLRPNIIQALIDLKLTDSRTRQQIMEEPDLDKRKQLFEKHADDMWLKTKKIISEMRTELELEEYPESLLRMWR